MHIKSERGGVGVIKQEEVAAAAAVVVGAEVQAVGLEAAEVGDGWAGSMM